MCFIIEKRIKICNSSIHPCTNCIVLSLCCIVSALIMWKAAIKFVKFILTSIHIDFAALQLRVNLNFQLQSYAHNESILQKPFKAAYETDKIS